MRNESKLSPIKRVSIRPGVSILSILRHLNYKPWFALAEFVDNAVESYVSHREKLEELHGRNFKLRVEIDLEPGPSPRITIRDNAAGIARSVFPQAFRPAAIPSNRSGLSEFGMGMKSAACWFAPKWQVRTTALLEDIERTVRFEVEQIVHDQLEELEIVEAQARPETHYTEIILENLHHAPVKRTVAKIKEHLTDIYRVFISEHLLELKVGGETLNYSAPKVLTAPFARESNARPHVWRKNIRFDFGQGLSAKGFAALMDPMNTARSGFALFRRGRLIQGSGDEGYRPGLIFGQAGNFRWRRLFGELHLEGFDVSHTKDGFQWDENEQPFLELLKDELDEEQLPLLWQADHFRVQASRNEVADAAQQALARAVDAMQATLPELLPSVVDQPPVETQTTPLVPEPALATREIRVDFRGQAWLIRIELTNDPAQGAWLDMSDQTGAELNSHTIEIRISLAHPFMVSFAQIDPDGVEALVRVAAGLALSEKLARVAGVRMAKTIRRNLNELLREALSRL